MSRSLRMSHVTARALRTAEALRRGGLPTTHRGTEAQKGRCIAGSRGQRSTLSRVSLQNLFESLGRPRKDGASAFLDDRPLNQIGMLHHQIDDLIV